MLTQHYIHHFLKKFAHLKRGGTKFGPAPHKGVLLFAIIELIQTKKITQNKIPLGQELIDVFDKQWKLLVTTGHKRNIGLPIYHLQNDGFWTTVTKENQKLQKVVSSNKQFLGKLSYGKFHADLFALLQVPENIPLFQMVLLDTFFSDAKKAYELLPNEINEMDQMVLDPKPRYETKTTVRENFVRDWKFKKYVMKFYEHTCCISKLNVNPNHSLIQAAHIKQHSKFGIDTITNGLALSAHLHTAFDSGLISIDSNYQVLVNNNFTENKSSPLNLKQFQGTKIILPKNSKFYPAQENLAWHRKEFGF